MIKVNLIGSSRKKAPKASLKLAMPASLTPFLLVVIAAAAAVSGYWWYTSMTGQVVDLDKQIRLLEARKAELEAVIKQDQVFEARKTMLENRVKIIEGLQKNQVSPVMALDELSEAVEKTQYVWLSSLDQKDAVLSMAGVGTSLTAIADFYTNLNATGYFKNVDLGPSQENGGNFTFSLKCEFAPPRGSVSNIPAPAAGGN
jgi:Tfp pilus assembly protein PilN